jgi:hypothetical protein
MPESRRTFLKRSAALGAVIAAGPLARAAGQSSAPSAAAPAAKAPWYTRTLRWGQTNITEIDPTRYDIGWWREQWKRTAVQGVIINAGGIVAYYPSAVPLHHRAQFLGDRDLFGELCGAAHEDGLAVFARMDSNSAHEDFHRAHPDWFAVDESGRPYRNRDLYVTCVNSPYYDEHIAAILREIATRYHPEGFTDNSWSGLGRNSPCYCRHCEAKFRARTGQPLPRKRDWNDPLYREWIQWNYERRLEIWDQNNRVTRAAGGPDCIWVGMNGGHVAGQAQQFRDFKRICERAPMLMLDDQRRQNDTGFQRNGEVGKLVHGLLGWDKIMPESMALYQTTSPTFRLTTKPPAEARQWMYEGFAGGIQPWWHHVGAYQEDRRQFHTAEPAFQWHRTHEAYLINRRPIATVAVGWSQRNTDFFGRDDAGLNIDQPANGFMQALVRARIPYLPVHLDDLDRDGGTFRALILPNMGAMSDSQVAAVKRFVARGGGLLATGHTSLADEWGDCRTDYALGDLFGAHLPIQHGARDEAVRRRWAAESAHSYLRLAPSLAARAPGPHVAAEPPVTSSRHAVLRGFDETDILPFGGTLEPLRLDATAQVIATHVPSFPAFPPETSWMREPKTDIPAVILNAQPGAGRVAFVPADIDRRYARDNLPDHGDLLAHLVRWVAADAIPLQVDGPGLIDCHLYQQPGRVIVHVVNPTSAGTWRAPVEELIPVGPLRFAVNLPAGVRGTSVRPLVGSTVPRVVVRDRWAHFELSSVLDHEVLVVS